MNSLKTYVFFLVCVNVSIFAAEKPFLESYKGDKQDVALDGGTFSQPVLRDGKSTYIVKDFDIDRRGGVFFIDSGSLRKIFIRDSGEIGWSRDGIAYIADAKKQKGLIVGLGKLVLERGLDTRSDARSFLKKYFGFKDDHFSNSFDKVSSPTIGLHEDLGGTRSQSPPFRLETFRELAQDPSAWDVTDCKADGCTYQNKNSPEKKVVVWEQAKSLLEKVEGAKAVVPEVSSSPEGWVSSEFELKEALKKAKADGKRFVVLASGNLGGCPPCQMFSQMLHREVLPHEPLVISLDTQFNSIPGYGSSSYPTIYILDTDGGLKEKFQGRGVSAQELRSKLQGYLKAKP